MNCIINVRPIGKKENHPELQCHPGQFLAWAEIQDDYINSRPAIGVNVFEAIGALITELMESGPFTITNIEILEK